MNDVGTGEKNGSIRDEGKKRMFEWRVKEQKRRKREMKRKKKKEMRKKINKESSHGGGDLFVN